MPTCSGCTREISGCREGREARPSSASHEPTGAVCVADMGSGKIAQFRLFECIRTEMEQGSPEGYNAKTGFSEPAQKPQTGEPYEHQSLYRIGRSQEKHQLLREDRRRTDFRGRQIAGDVPSAAGVGTEALRAVAW